MLLGFLLLLLLFTLSLPIVILPFSSLILRRHTPANFSRLEVMLAEQEAAEVELLLHKVPDLGEPWVHLAQHEGEVPAQVVLLPEQLGHRRLRVGRAVGQILDQVSRGGKTTGHHDCTDEKANRTGRRPCLVAVMMRKWFWWRMLPEYLSIKSCNEGKRKKNCM